MKKVKFDNLTIVTARISENLNKVTIRHMPTEIEASRQNISEGFARHEALQEVVSRVKESGEDL